VGLTSLAAYGISRYWLEDSVETARAVTFSVLVFDELLRSLAARSNRKTIFQLGWFGNPWLLGAVLACCLLQTAVMLTPVVRGIFAMPSLDWQHWLLILLLAMIPITVVEITKLVRKLMDSSTLSSSSTNSQVSLGI
jgi:Ca2+-transporting ATPase